MLKRFLGDGATKIVFEAHDELLDRDVALAVIRTEGLDEVGHQRVLREARTMAGLGEHPHIVQIYDLGDDNGRPYMILPLLTGGHVGRLIKKRANNQLTMRQFLGIAKDVCRGLAFAHTKGIVHRDLKPANVWLAGDGTAKIGDFGLAVAMGRSRITQKGLMVGTVWYVSPEQARAGEIDPRSDLYSLGCMLYHMLAGRPPFRGEHPVSIIGQHMTAEPAPPSRYNPRCPAAAEKLILTLLAKEPSDRPESAEDTLRELEAIELGASPILSAPTMAQGPSALRNGGAGTTGETEDRRATAVLVEDHDLLREGTKQLLLRDALVEVVGEAVATGEAISLIEDLQPDVVVLDISLKEGTGADVVRACWKVAPETKVLILSASDDYHYVRSFLKMGVRGYLVKTATATELVRAVLDVVGGKLVFPPGIADKVLDILQR